MSICDAIPSFACAREGIRGIVGAYVGNGCLISLRTRVARSAYLSFFTDSNKALTDMSDIITDMTDIVAECEW